MPSQYRQTIFVLRASCSPSDGRHASAPVDRTRERTSHRNPIRSLYWRSKARSPHWASVTAVSPGHKSEAGAHQKFGAQVLSGCSWRIGSVLKIAPFGPSPAGGTRRFATLHSARHRAATFREPHGKTYRYFRPRGWSRLRLFPWHRRPGSHVPYQSPVELRAAYTPDAARAVSGHPPS